MNARDVLVVADDLKDFHNYVQIHHGKVLQVGQEGSMRYMLAQLGDHKWLAVEDPLMRIENVKELAKNCLSPGYHVNISWNGTPSEFVSSVSNLLARR